jgi:hypothetical protein
MNIGWDFRREQLRPEQRSHYVITNGGDQPNVIPPLASVWYFFRELDFENIKKNYEIGNKIAEAAAMMTDTKMTRKVVGVAAPRHFNKPIAEAMQGNIDKVGLPQWTEDEQQFARAVQRLSDGKEDGLPSTFKKLEAPPAQPESGGSDDIGDVSWVAPTVTLRYPANIPNLPGHKPITPLASIPFVLFARKDIPANNLKDLVAWLKGHTGQASAGMNTLSLRLVATFFQKQTGTQFVIVPYRAAVSVIEDLVAGRTDLAIDTPIRLPLVQSGNIKAYAVTSEARLAVAPDIPTFAELGLPALSYSQWYGLFAPTGTSQSIVDKLKFAAVEALADPVVPARLAPFGMELFPHERQTPEALAAMQKADAEKWWPLIKELGIKAE